MVLNSSLCFRTWTGPGSRAVPTTPAASTLAAAAVAAATAAGARRGVEAVLEFLGLLLMRQWCQSFNHLFRVTQNFGKKKN